MLSTAIAVTVMAFPVVVIVMVAARIRIIFQTACGQCLCCSIRAAGHTGIQLYPGFSQRHLSTAADPAADQGVRLGCLQETGQCSVTASAWAACRKPASAP